MVWVYVIIIGIIVWWIYKRSNSKNTTTKTPVKVSDGGISQARNPIKPNILPTTNNFPKEPLEQKLVSNIPDKEKVWKYPPISLLDNGQSSLYSILSSTPMRESKSKLEIALGFDALGNPVIGDVAKLLNLSITGKENTGKTSLIKVFLTSILFRAAPTEVKLIITDLSRLNLTSFNDIPHLLSPVIVEPERVISALRWTMAEMDRRYKLFVQAGAKNIDSYNEMSGFQALPYIVFFVDEVADLMLFSPAEIEDGLTMILERGFKTGIHCVISMRKPVKKIISLIQSRVAFLSDGEKETQPAIARSVSFLAPHDFLLQTNNETFPLCIQSPILSDKNLIALVQFIKNQDVEQQYSEEVITMVKAGTVAVPGMEGGNTDDLFKEAVKVVCQYDRASASLIQRRLSIGYARAARIIDQLEATGVISASDGSSKPREVLVQNAEEFLASLANSPSHGI